MAGHTLRAGTGEVRWFERYAKALLAGGGTLLGAATPVGVAQVADGFGWHWSAPFVTSLCAVLAPLGALITTVLGPANKEPLDLDVPPREG